MDPIQVGALARSQSSHAACPTAYDAATTAAASDAAAAAAPNDESGDSPEATISISKNALAYQKSWPPKRLAEASPPKSPIIISPLNTPSTFPQLAVP